MPSNLPPGVSEADSYFDAPPECEHGVTPRCSQCAEFEVYLAKETIKNLVRRMEGPRNNSMDKRAIGIAKQFLKNDEDMPGPTLGEWFGFSYSPWLVLPRILMEDMPQPWQQRMADLLFDFCEEYPGYDEYTKVTLTQGETSVRKAMPEWLTRQGYRHPGNYRAEIAACRKKDKP